MYNCTRRPIYLKFDDFWNMIIRKLAVGSVDLADVVISLDTLDGRGYVREGVCDNVSIKWA